MLVRGKVDLRQRVSCCLDHYTLTTNERLDSCDSFLPGSCPQQRTPPRTVSATDKPTRRRRPVQSALKRYEPNLESSEGYEPTLRNTKRRQRVIVSRCRKQWRLVIGLLPGNAATRLSHSRAARGFMNTTTSASANVERRWGDAYLPTFTKLSTLTTVTNRLFVSSISLSFLSLLAPAASSTRHSSARHSRQ